MKDYLSVCIYSFNEKIWGGGQVSIENLCRYMSDNDLPSIIVISEPQTFSYPTLTIPSVSFKNRTSSNSFFSFLKQLRNSSVQETVLNDPYQSKGLLYEYLC